MELTASDIFNGTALLAFMVFLGRLHMGLAKDVGKIAKEVTAISVRQQMQILQFDEHAREEQEWKQQLQSEVDQLRSSQLSG